METQRGDAQNGGAAVANSTRRSLQDGDDDDSLEDVDSSRKTMSSLARFFIGSAVFHACAVVAFQSAILGLGDFSPDCQGGLGFDRKIYAILFISAMAYVIVLVIWALYSENIVEIYSFCVVQLLSIAYSCTQVYQFYTSRTAFEQRQPDSVKAEDYEAPIILAVSNVILSVCMMVFYIYATYHLYIEFGWKIYTTVPFKAEAKLRGAFSTYQIFTCFLKVELFFTEMFLLSHVTLLLRDDTRDPEFIASVVAMVLAIVVVVLIYLAVRRENKVAMVCFLVVLLAMCGYYSFKVFRFVTKSCRLCKSITMENCPMSFGASEPTTTAPNDNLTFEHLSLFAIIVDINTALLFLVSLNYMSKFGSGLEKFFKGWKGLKLLSMTRTSTINGSHSVTNMEFTQTETRSSFQERSDQRRFSPRTVPVIELQVFENSSLPEAVRKMEKQRLRYARQTIRHFSSHHGNAPVSTSTAGSSGIVVNNPQQVVTDGSAQPANHSSHLAYKQHYNVPSPHSSNLPAGDDAMAWENGTHANSDMSSETGGHAHGAATNAAISLTENSYL